MAAVLTFFQTFLAIGNTVIMCYACGKFLGKPKVSIENRLTSIENRLTIVENRLDKTDERLLNGNDRFRAQDKTNSVVLRSTLALIEFEIHYCITEGKNVTKELENAKDELQTYLIRSEGKTMGGD